MVGSKQRTVGSSQWAVGTITAGLKMLQHYFFSPKFREILRSELAKFGEIQGSKFREIRVGFR
jgi:hypothetical protein